MERNKGQFTFGLYLILMMAFFIGCFFLLLQFGTNAYRNIVDRQSDNSLERALSSYLLTVSRNGESGIYAKINDQDGQMLMVEEGNSGYGNRIYLYDGYLVEDYGKLDGELFPDLAIRIAETDLFEIEMVKDDLMKVRTDAGVVYLHLRNEEVLP